MERTGLSKSTISAYVTGQRTPDPPACDLISDALGVDLDIVLWQAGHRPNVEAKSADDPRLEFYGLIDRIDWTVPGTQKMARSVLRNLVDMTKEAKA